MLGVQGHRWTYLPWVAVAIAATFVGLATDAVAAEAWAPKMFNKTRHDFGVVARGAVAEIEFPLDNIYKEEAHISDVRSSCGCTTAAASQTTFKSHEKGCIKATLNTRAFLGQKHAVVTVVFDKPYVAEVQLDVSGYIRSDIVMTPGRTEFGEIDLGQAAEKDLTIDYAGRGDWKIVDVRSANEHLEAELIETKRTGSQVGYKITIRLKDTAPTGDFTGQLLLMTNDKRLTSVPYTVQGRVLSPLTVNPTALALGVVETGQKVTKNLVVRGKKPFRITSVECPDGCLNFATSDMPKSMHLVPVTYTAGEQPGKLDVKFEIKTDLGPHSSASCTATATVKPHAGS